MKKPNHRPDVGARFIAPGPATNQTLRRRNPRLIGYDYTQAGAYFVTICTAGRECMFGDVIQDEIVLSPLGHLVREVWEQIPDQDDTITTDAFVVMPNHVHGVIVLLGTTRGTAVATKAMNRAPTLGDVVRALKARVTIEGRRRGMVNGTLWQRGYHDHIIRDEGDLERIRRYIDDNPMAWALDEENPLQSKGRRTSP